MRQNKIANSKKKSKLRSWSIIFIFFAISICIARLYNFLSPMKYEAGVTVSTGTSSDLNENKINKSINSFRNSLNLVEIIEKYTLYSEQFSRTNYRNISLYKNRPVKILVKNPSTLRAATNIPFTTTQYFVVIAEKGYPFSKWVETPYGQLKFFRNPLTANKNTEKNYFNLIPYKEVSASLNERLNIELVRDKPNYLHISFEDGNKQEALDILNDMVSWRQKALDQLKKVLAINSARFVNNKIESTEQTLLGIEQQLNLLTNQERNALQKSGASYLKEVNRFDKEIAKTNVKLMLLDQLELYSKSTDNKLFLLPNTAGVVNDSLSSHLMNLYTVRARRQENLVFSELDLPLVSSNEAKTMYQLSKEINAIRLKLKSILIKSSDSANRSSLKLQNLSQKEQNLVFLQRQGQINTNIYTDLLQLKEQAALVFIINSGEIEIIDTPKIIKTFFLFENEWVYFFAIVAASLLSVGYLLFYKPAKIN